MLNSVFEVNEQTIQIDHEGFLLEPSEWNRDVAQAIADKEGVVLNEDAWEIVMFVREHFEVNQCIPEARRLLQALGKTHGKEKATRQYIYNMFPYGYGQQACKIAGMRAPLKILLDL